MSAYMQDVTGAQNMRGQPARKYAQLQQQLQSTKGSAVVSCAERECPSYQTLHSACTMTQDQLCGVRCDPWGIASSQNDDAQEEGCPARDRADNLLGESAKMNLAQQFEQSVAAEEGANSLQVGAWCSCLFSKPLNKSLSQIPCQTGMQCCQAWEHTHKHFCSLTMLSGRRALA